MNRQTLHGPLDSLEELGLPGTVISALEEGLASGDDTALIETVQMEGLLLLVILRHASGSRLQPVPRSRDLLSAWRQLGSRRSRALLEALILIAPRRLEDPLREARRKKLRQTGSDLLIQCGLSDPVARTLLSLLEIVLSLSDEVARGDQRAWAIRLLGMMERPHLYHEDLVNPLKFLAGQHAVSISDEQLRLATALGLAVKLSEGQGLDNEELAEVCSRLDLKPWQIGSGELIND
jgi:hypothetical protein